MTTILEFLTERGFEVTFMKDTASGEKAVRMNNLSTGTANIGTGATIELAILNALCKMVCDLERYLIETGSKLERATDMLHKNGMVLNALDEREMAEMRKVYVTPQGSTNVITGGDPDLWKIMFTDNQRNPLI